MSTPERSALLLTSSR